MSKNPNQTKNDYHDEDDEDDADEEDETIWLVENTKNKSYTFHSKRDAFRYYYEHKMDCYSPREKTCKYIGPKYDEYFWVVHNYKQDKNHTFNNKRQAYKYYYTHEDDCSEPSEEIIY